MYHLDVMLVNPGTELESRGRWNREPPVGLLYLAAVLEMAGFNVQILEGSLLGLDLRELDDLQVPVPGVVGFTSLTNNFPRAVRIARKLREKFATDSEDRAPPPFIIGGPHVTFRADDALDTGAFDACVRGEGESTVCNIIELALDAGTGPSFRHRLSKNIKGDVQVSGKNGTGKDVLEKEELLPPNLVWHDENGVTRESRAAFTGIANLDDLPFPARHLLPINAPGHSYDVATVIVNRGCPNQCIFCSRQALFERARWRTPARVVKEIESIHEFGTYSYYNLYDNLTISRRFMKDLLRIMSRRDWSSRFNLPWGAELRADMIDAESARLLLDANCVMVATGIESANEKILKMAGKFQDVEKIRKGLQILKNVGLRVQAYFVVGLPGETTETFEETVKFLETSPLEPGVDHVDFFAATPYPGSGLSMRKKELGLEVFNHDISTWDCQHLVYRAPGLSFDELREIWRRAKEIEREFNGETEPVPDQ